ncbi:MAG: hypothetical protein K2X48_14230 [Chitinophagaceae bacterium]|nr:hypothetical protein [Chitinophagaceae bacterium]
MNLQLLHKNQTGIASEFYVAGELSRMGFNVTFTFGNTKSMDLIVEKDDKLLSIQVKGIQRTKSICWNLDKTKIRNNVIYVLVNLHVDNITTKPDFFVLTAKQAKALFKNSIKEGEKRAYLDYKSIKDNPVYKNNWTLFFEA